MQRKHREALANGIIEPDQVKLLEKEFESKFEEEIRKLDMELIMELDQVVSEEQVTLEKANVPGFHVTNKPNEIQLQMYILNFINRLSIMNTLQSGEG